MKRILVVEPNVELCLELAEMLMEFGFEVGVSDTSERALNTLSDADPLPDVLLIDITEGEGQRFRESIRHDPRYCNIKVVKINGCLAYPAPEQMKTVLATALTEQIPSVQ